VNVLALDTEITTWNKGHAFDPRNKLVCYSACTSHESWADLWDGDSKTSLQQLITEADLYALFNAKFDLQWLVKEGLTYTPTKVWDCQLAHFILSNQTHRYPSLNEVAEHYGLPVKPNVVKTEYWDKGINTDAIPWHILEEYAIHDAQTTYQIYLRQREELTGNKLRLFRLQCQDLSLLREMEANGIPFDEELCQVRAKELDDKISTINTKLSEIYPNVPINFGSNDHLSAFLYGGVVKEDAKEFVGYFKSGERQGQPKYKNVVIEHTLPRLYQPLKGSEMAKAGNYAVDEGTMRKLKGNKSTVALLLELSKLEKLNGTYYKGLVKLREEMGWDVGILHGNFNQTTAQTGRLSSSRPNLQNFATELQDIFVSQY
jgi:DNA polymerase I-like protein with 3'-5' exonuclease and polymerase domains